MDRYEVLRAQVLGTHGAGISSPGWALLVRQGLAAWLRALGRFIASSAPVSSHPPVATPPGVQQEITNILTSMIWSHYPKEAS